eukprot:1748431-Pyramimonas_sp.AAC.1
MLPNRSPVDLQFYRRMPVSSLQGNEASRPRSPPHGPPNPRRPDLPFPNYPTPPHGPPHPH